jgi:hypothetical protein
VPESVIFTIVLHVLLALRPNKPRYYLGARYDDLLAIEGRERVVFVEWQEG